MNNLQQILQLRDRGAFFIVNHSGGKDSQAMTILLEKIIPDEQLILIHADLMEADWEGCWQHIEEQHRMREFYICNAVDADGNDKKFMDLVDRRKMWPSPTTRNCTSDLKRTPIEKTVRHLIKDDPERFGKNPIIVNCMGIRAEESVMRSKGMNKKHYDKTGEAITFVHDSRNSRGGREYYQWYPIFDMKLQEVWDTIKEAGQEPHWVYAEGMSRLSCAFCIMANPQDLRTAALLAPERYKKYCDKERELMFTFAMPVGGKKKYLPEITGIDPDNNPGPEGIDKSDEQEDYDDGDCGGYQVEEDEPEEPIAYKSGNIRSINETRALVELGMAIGITVNSDKNTKALAVEYATKGNYVFCDNGAFSEFAKGTDLSWRSAEDFWEKVFGAFYDLALQVPYEKRRFLIFVMPDHIGDYMNTQDNLKHFIGDIMCLVELNVTVMWNLQKVNQQKYDWQFSLSESLKYMQRTLRNILAPDEGWNEYDYEDLERAVTWGVPSNAQAWTEEDLRELNDSCSELPCRTKVHLLGKGDPAELGRLQEECPNLYLSGDSVATRSMTGKGKPLTELPKLYVAQQEKVLGRELSRPERGVIRKMVFKNILWTKYEMRKVA